MTSNFSYGDDAGASTDVSSYLWRQHPLEHARNVLLGIGVAPWMDADLWRRADVHGDALLFWSKLSPARRATLYDEFQTRMSSAADSAQYRGRWTSAGDMTVAMRPLVYLVTQLHRDAARVLRAAFPSASASASASVNEPLGNHFLRKYREMGDSRAAGWLALTYVTSSAAARTRLYVWATRRYVHTSSATIKWLCAWAYPAARRVRGRAPPLCRDVTTIVSQFVGTDADATGGRRMDDASNTRRLL
jgi:hypothetical protein